MSQGSNVKMYITNLFIQSCIIRQWKSCFSTSRDFVQEIQDCNVPVKTVRLSCYIIISQEGCYYQKY